MVDDKDIKVVIAAHKPYWMPDDDMYVPIQAGSVGKESIPGFQRDDSGDNISDRNPNYCELTALYWAWKNLSADYIGLSHYRRHFAGAGSRNTLTSSEAARLLTKAPAILPRMRHYYIETIQSHYSHTFDNAHVDVLCSALGRVSPEYLPSFERHMRSTSAHMFNMFVMRSDLLDEYCDWLFRVLAEAEKSIDLEGMDAFNARCMGRLSELLIDVWINTRSIDYTERKVIDMESVNWLKKGGSFLSAKLFGRKYTESF